MCASPQGPDAASPRAVTPVPRAAGTHRAATLAALVVGVAAALMFSSMGAAGAARVYSRTASWTATATATGTGSASQKVTATASYGDPAVSRSRTGTASVVKRAGASKTSVATVRVSAGSSARARALAVIKAKAAAVRAAQAGAAALARSRATAAARTALPATAKTVWASLYAKALADAKTAARKPTKPGTPVTTPPTTTPVTTPPATTTPPTTTPVTTPPPTTTPPTSTPVTTPPTTTPPTSTPVTTPPTSTPVTTPPVTDPVDTTPSPAPAQPCGDTIYKADGTAWTCTFDDEFNGTSLDTSKWMVATTANTGLYTGSPDPSAPGCFVDSSKNVYEADGVLNLVARRETTPVTCQLLGGGSWQTQYTAGQVASKDHFSQTYGRFDVRAKFPSVDVPGMHSGLWMWPQDNSTQVDKLGEIDIVEWYSQYSKMVMPSTHYNFDQSTVDWTGNTNVNNATTWGCSIDTANSAFHTYSVEWTSKKITFSYDGKLCLTNVMQPSDTSPFDQPYFMVLTQALGLGGNAPTDSTPLPSGTQVDWVRVWK